MTVVRYVHGQDNGEAPQDQAPQAAPSTRVHTGTIFYSPSRGGDVVEQSHTSFTHSFDGQPGGSVMATLQKVGGAATVELEPGNPASRTLLSTAIKEGLVEQHAPGLYRDALRLPAGDREPDESTEPQEVTDEDDEGSPFDMQEEEEWGQIIEPLPQHAYDAALASGIMSILQDKPSFEDSAKGLSNSAQLEPEQALALMQTGYEKHRREVDRALTHMGIEEGRLDEFYEAVRGNKMALQEALERLVYARDVSGFRELASIWMAKNPSPTLQMLEAQGFEVFTDRKTGRSMARREGGDWVPVRKLLST